MLAENAGVEPQLLSFALFLGMTTGRHRVR